MTRSIGAPALVMDAVTHEVIRLLIEKEGADRVFFRAVAAVGRLVEAAGCQVTGEIGVQETTKRIGDAWVYLHALAQLVGERGVRDIVTERVRALKET